MPFCCHLLTFLELTFSKSSFRNTNLPSECLTNSFNPDQARLFAKTGTKLGGDLGEIVALGAEISP